LAYLAVLQPDARAEARLGDALGGVHRVSFVRSWSELRRLLARETLDGCVVDADFPNREDAVTEMRRLRTRYGDLALVAYADVHEDDFELYRFGGLGVNSVVLARRPPWASGIRRAVEHALASARGERVRRALEGRHCPAAAAAVAWTVEHAELNARVDDFAAAQGRSVRELTHLLQGDGLPSPGRLLIWGRLLRAGAYLGKDGRTVEETALRLGYSAASALARAMKRETGQTPSAVAERGGLAFVHARLFPSGPPRRRGNGARALAAALLALWPAACATVATGGTGPERNRVDAVLDAPPMDQVHFGVLAVDAATGEVLKTGTTSNVNSLSGYLVGKNGREVVFSILSNGSGLPSSRVRAALDDVIKVLAGISP
jgi:AraC-like DNA-binding protein